MNEWLKQKQVYFGWNTKLNINRKQPLRSHKLIDNAKEFEIVIRRGIQSHVFHVRPLDYINKIVIEQIKTYLKLLKWSGDQLE